jgi:hypothetical protein
MNKKNAVLGTILLAVVVVLFVFNAPNSLKQDEVSARREARIAAKKAVDDSIAEALRKEASRPTFANIGDTIRHWGMRFCVVSARVIPLNKEEGYLAVVLMLENVGDEEVTVSMSDFCAMDKQNRRHDASYEGSVEAALADVKVLMTETIQPGMRKKRCVVFEVSPGDSAFVFYHKVTGKIADPGVVLSR